MCDVPPERRLFDDVDEHIVLAAECKTGPSSSKTHLKLGHDVTVLITSTHGRYPYKRIPQIEYMRDVWDIISCVQHPNTLPLLTIHSLAGNLTPENHAGRRRADKRIHHVLARDD